MDESRINRAYSNLKQAQLLLHRLVSITRERLQAAEAGTPGPVSDINEVAAVTTHLINAQDDLIVLRESMQALVFENAGLRQQLEDAGLAAGPAGGQTSVLPGVRNERASEARS